MSAVSSKRPANLTISLFQSLRVEESFKSFNNVVMKKLNEQAFISQAKLPGKLRAPDCSIIHQSNGQSNAYHPNSPRDYYTVIYYEALGSLITSLKRRFDQPCFKAYGNLKSLLLKYLSNESIANKIEYAKCVYKGDLDVDWLVIEVQMLKAMCQNKNFEI